MAIKSFVLTYGVSVILSGASLLSLHGLSVVAVSPEESCVAQVALSQEGVREHGPNQGPEVDQYIRTTNFSEPIPWCAAFVAWAHGYCCVDNPESAWSPAWFPKSNLVYHRGEITARNNHPQYQKPEPGDVFGLYFANRGRVAHVGLVVEWGEGSYFTTIEGNTNMAGSREGDGVYRKYRSKGTVYQISRYED